MAAAGAAAGPGRGGRDSRALCADYEEELRKAGLLMDVEPARLVPRQLRGTIKTSVCVPFARTGRCEYGRDCYSAHSVGEIEPRSLPDDHLRVIHGHVGRLLVERPNCAEPLPALARRYKKAAGHPLRRLGFSDLQVMEQLAARGAVQVSRDAIVTWLGRGPTGEPAALPAARRVPGAFEGDGRGDAKDIAEERDLAAIAPAPAPPGGPVLPVSDEEDEAEGAPAGGAAAPPPAASRRRRKPKPKPKIIPPKPMKLAQVARLMEREAKWDFEAREHARAHHRQLHAAGATLRDRAHKSVGTLPERLSTSQPVPPRSLNSKKKKKKTTKRGQ